MSRKIYLSLLSLAFGCAQLESGDATDNTPSTYEAAANAQDTGATVFTACTKAVKGMPRQAVRSSTPDDGSGAPRITLRRLVVSAADVGTDMVKAGLDEALVPCTELDLTDANRPVIDDAFLAETLGPTLRMAKFQAVVLPSEAPPQLTEAELAALARFEREFGIRQFSSYVYPSPTVGLHSPNEGGYDGSLDGLTAFVTEDAKADAFAYLAGPVPFDDVDPKQVEANGYLALPLPADEAQARSFRPFVTAPMPGTANKHGVMLGVYTEDGREQLVMTAAVNAYQFQQQLLMPGILQWLTRGVHLGTERNFFSVHIDDIFLPNARWSTLSRCTIGATCQPDAPSPKILMTADDVDFLEAWQAKNSMKLDLLFNGSGYDRAVTAGKFPLGERLLAKRASFRWLSHTYNHLYLGCTEDFSVDPVRCKTDTKGNILWANYQDVLDQITKNQDFAQRRGLKIDPHELVTGEHSGLRRAPQEPSDNPNLARALTTAGILWLGSDSSREWSLRRLGSALTSPRYPMNVYYDAATVAETVDQYNFIYTSAADGGSGQCERDPKSTCIEPLDPKTGFDEYIVPSDAHAMLMHVVSNSPRAHFAHQANLAEDRVIYPFIERVLRDYRNAFASEADIVNASLAELGAELQNQQLWAADNPNVSAYVQGNRLFIERADDATERVPLTLPAGSALPGADSLQPFAGYRTGWTPVGASGLTLTLPAGAGFRERSATTR
jgi:hypothetical protein